MRMSCVTAVLVAAGMLVGGCATMHRAEMNSRKADLKFRAYSAPAKVWVDTMPGNDRGPQAKTMRISLAVTNKGNSTYKGTSPNAAVIRVRITQKDREIWTGPQAAAVITEVTIGSGQTETYSVNWDIPDARTLALGGVFAEIEFLPTQEKLQLLIPVERAH